ncbi:polysaccharide biosynthesis/export family protein [Wenzhouxiangella sediminis]|uniref:Iron dicitrate ABC transporter ATP-binding protein n=1 Tax=Wenzhouxiangella sediminis TaxID=1792836 RepID=A0A3E1KCC0_9GAMM|nr:polysaccharide biosynthesis/export family protein [Wenzhouxiangella sediminis]RFF32496.1 iron dicitrate ABC transporter ATP-binding protein [Wenzhouxiangella sediminis]
MRVALAFLASIGLLLAGCAGSGSNRETTLQDFQKDVAAEERVSDINNRLMNLAVEGASDSVYRVGAEDRIRVNIFGVEDLSGEYRVNGAGRVLLPLVGEVSIAGLTLGEVEQAIAEAYAEDYLRDPQVSVEVVEYRSQQFTVIGAVEQPRVYNVSRQITLVEALAMAGGISAEAGSQVYLTDRVRNPDTNKIGTRTLIIDVENLMQEAEEYNLVLGESAMINVPRGGYVYVEGAVENPGAYPQRADTTVLKALAEAGGLSFEASKGNIRVMRRTDNGGWEAQDIDYDRIRDNPNLDVPLDNGDVVLVSANAFKEGWVNMWRVIQPIALLGFRPL